MWNIPDTYAVPIRNPKPSAQRAHRPIVDETAFAHRIVDRCRHQGISVVIAWMGHELRGLYEGTIRYSQFIDGGRTAGFIGRYNGDADPAEVAQDIREFFE